jgi:hypothetical protein
VFTLIHRLISSEHKLFLYHYLKLAFLNLVRYWLLVFRLTKNKYTYDLKLFTPNQVTQILKTNTFMKNRLNALICLVWLSGISVAMAQVAAPAGTTVEGTPYLSESYVPGEILYAKGNLAKLPVRYNAFQDLIEYQQNGNAFVIDPTTQIKKINMGDHTFIVDKFEDKGKTKYGFLTLLDSGKVMLLSKKMIKYSDARVGRDQEGTEVKYPAKFSKAPDTYYYKIENGELQKVGNIKEMIATFPDKQEELTKFVKKEKISPRKEKDLLQLVRYYNSL